MQIRHTGNLGVFIWEEFKQLKQLTKLDKANGMT